MVARGFFILCLAFSIACGESVEVPGGETGGDAPLSCAVCETGCSLEHGWSESFAGTNTTNAEGVVVAENGAIVVGGSVKGAADLGGGPLDDLGSWNSIVVARFDRDGVHQWSQVLGGTDNEGVHAVAGAPDGSVAMAGFMSAPIDLGGGVIAGNTFVVVLDAEGQHVWSTAFANSEQTLGEDIAIDASGNVIVAGHGVGPSSGNESGVFIAKYEPSGGLLWNHVLPIAHEIAPPALALQTDGSIVLASSFAGGVDLAGTSRTSAAGIVVALLTADGDVRSVYAATSDYALGVDDVVVDVAGDILLTGSAGANVDFGVGRVELGVSDVFLLKLDWSGKYRWAQTFGSTKPIAGRGTGLAVDADGRITLLAAANAVDFGGGPVGDPTFEHGIVLARFDPCGTHLWSRGVGENDDPFVGHLASSPDGAVVAAGTFMTQIDFGGGPHTTEGLENALYLAKQWIH